MTDPHLVDAAGTQHARASDGARIVSLVPSITELVCELGLTDQLVGRTGFCTHPREALRRVPKVGGTKDVDLQKLRQLRPTHVIVNIDENKRETAEAIVETGARLIVTHPLGPHDNLTLFRLVGGIFAKDDQAEALCAQLTAELDRAAQTSFPPRKVLYLIWRDPWMTISADTYIARMLKLVNWETLAISSDSRYPEIDLGRLPAVPNVVLLSSEPYPFRERHKQEIRDALGSEIAVNLIDGDQVSWYGSRAISGVRYLSTMAGSMALR